MMLSHLTSSATDEDIDFAVVIFVFPYVAGKNMVQSSTTMRGDATRFPLCGRHGKQSRKAE
jgi:hypothetical protein